MIESMSEEIKRHEKSLEAACRRDKLEALEKGLQELFELPEAAIRHIIKKSNFDNRENSFDDVEKEAYNLASFAEKIAGYIEKDIRERIMGESK